MHKFICLEAELYLEQGDINSAADAAAQAVKLDEAAMFLEKRQCGISGRKRREDRNGQKSVVQAGSCIL